MKFKELRSYALASIIEETARTGGDYTGPLSTLDEASSGFALKHASVSLPHKQFHEARGRYQRSWDGSRFSPEMWTAVQESMMQLAAALRALGDIHHS